MLTVVDDLLVPAVRLPAIGRFTFLVADACME